MAIPASRDEKIANFYREHAARLHRGVCGKTVGLDDATIQDACATAWERLLERPDIDLERYEAYPGGCTRSRCARRGRPAVGSVASSPWAA